jgi:lipopolysaccharide export LptBFGC system permease protein LptF
VLFRSHYYNDQYRYPNRHHGSGIGLLIVGLIIVFLGVAALTGTFVLFWTYFWPIVLIILGVWLLLWGLRRTRRY